MLGIVVGETAYWDRGYGQEAIRLLLDFAFNLLNLNSVMLGTFAFNERALACYRNVGFREIGRQRQARIIAGEKYDIVLMDILAEEFESPYVKKLMEASST
jgi:RimJ/RimL family protein N-acetyltransferase